MINLGFFLRFFCESGPRIGTCVSLAYSVLLLCLVDIRGVSDAAKIKAIRYQIHVNLEDYVNDRQYESRGRFGEILLMLPSMHRVTRQLVELVQLAMSCGAVKVDNLLQEMLLGGTFNQQTISSQ